MKQLSIYNELGLEDDPVYEKLSKLTDNKSLQINGYEVYKNFRGLYEISSHEIHECASNLQQCYEKLSMHFEQDEKQDVINIANVF